MLRIFFISIVRFLLVAVVIYFVLTVVRKVLRTLSRPAQGSSPKATDRSQSENPSKPKEEYKDVKDAKFTELPGKKEGHADGDHG